MAHDPDLHLADTLMAEAYRQVKLADATPEFRSELQRLVSSGKFNVDSYTFENGGVKAVMSTFAKLGDIPPAVVTKAIESLPVPQQRPAWEAAISSMSDVDVLEGVSLGDIPFEFLAPALVPRLPAAVIYDHATDVSNEVLVGALKGVDARVARDLISRLPAARQEAIWKAYVTTLTPEEVAAGVKAGFIPAQYGPESHPESHPEFHAEFDHTGGWRNTAIDNDGRELGMFINRRRFTIMCAVDVEEPRLSALWLDSESYYDRIIEDDEREESVVQLDLPPRWTGNERKDTALFTKAFKAALSKMDAYIAQRYPITP